MNNNNFDFKMQNELYYILPIKKENLFFRSHEILLVMSLSTTIRISAQMLEIIMYSKNICQKIALGNPQWQHMLLIYGHILSSLYRCKNHNHIRKFNQTQINFCGIFANIKYNWSLPVIMLDHLLYFVLIKLLTPLIHILYLKKHVLHTKTLCDSPVMICLNVDFARYQ